MQKKAIANIILAIGFAGLFGFVGWNVWQNHFEAKKPEEIKIIPESVKPAAAAVEIGKTEDGQQVATFLSYPKYYEDEEGELKEVETAVVKNEAEDVKLPSGEIADWKVEKGVWKFYATNSGAVAFDNAGAALETQIRALVYLDQETGKYATIHSINPAFLTSDVRKTVVAGNQIIWPGIIEGVDYKVTYINDQLKEDIVLSTEARDNLPTPESLSIPSEKAQLGFLFDAKDSWFQGIEYYVTDGNKKTPLRLSDKILETEGEIGLADKDGGVRQTIEPGFVAVANPQPTTDNNLPLLKRFQFDRENGKRIYFSGAKFSDIQNLPEGDLLFDPTVSFQKVDGEDYSEVDDTYTYDTLPNYIRGISADLDVGDGTFALVKFPQFIGSASGQVPAGSSIVSAYFSVTTGSSAGDASANSVYIYKMLDQWIEGNTNGTAASSPGVYGATWDNAQDKYNSETAYINDGDGISASDTSVTVDDGSGGGITVSDWPPKGIIMIDSEIISYSGVTSTGFTGLARGVSGTTAATHSNNATVDGDITWVESGGISGPQGGSISGGYGNFAPSNDNTTYFVDVRTLVQEWVDSPDLNYGMLLYMDINYTDFAIFDSSENSDVSKRPKLIVSYAEGESGQAGLVNAYESSDTAVSPSSPGTATTATNFELATKEEDSGFWTTALSTTDNGYDSQVFKMQVPKATSTAPITVNWKGHGESAATNNTVSLNIWNFDTGAWEELDSGSARYNDTFTDLSTELNFSTQNVSSIAFNPTDVEIYIGGSAGGFKIYNPVGAGSFTDKTSVLIFGNSVTSLVHESGNNDIYAGGPSGRFKKYNPGTDSMTSLSSKLQNWGTETVSSLASDSHGRIFVGGSSGKFNVYTIATNASADLTSRISSFWSTNEILALTFDSAQNIIYLGGQSGKFAKYDPATDTATDLTSILGWSGGSYSLRTLTFDSADNVIYAGGYGVSGPKFAKYIPALNNDESLDGYLPATIGANYIFASAFDTANKNIYLAGGVGGGTTIARYFPETKSSQSLTSTVYDAIGNIQLNASVFADGTLYIGGNSGKFGKYAVSGNTTLSGAISSSVEDYRDSSGYAWLWVKATNEWSPPSVSSVSATPGQTTATVTWTTGEGATGKVEYRRTGYAYGCANGAVYCGTHYETDTGWKTSHSVVIGSGVLTCNPPVLYYYRVTSCDQWGSCTTSSESSFTPVNCGGGSCPFLFSWDGEKYDFQTDIISSGKMGLPAGKNGRRKPNADDYYFLKDDSLKAEGGRYKFKLTEERDEMDYLDNLKLYYVDHAPNLEVYTDQIRIGQERKGVAPVIYTVDKTALKKPASCTDYYGNDCLEKIAASDDDYTAPGELYRWDSMEMDLGDLRDSENIKLVLRSFQAVAGTFENQPAYDKNIHGPMLDVSFKLEVKNEAGEWQSIDVKSLSLSPTEFPRTYVADLTGVFLTEDYQMRLSYYNDTRFDYVAIDTSENVPVELREVELEKAELGNRLAVSQKDMEIGPYEPQYGQEIEDKERLAFSGNFTKYGDVKELLDSKDDRFLIFQKPDELDVEFRSAPNLSEGLERDFMLYSSGFYKVAKYGIAPTVDPLPFNAMSNYPYPEGEYPYKDDADYQTYLAKWNTRKIEPGQRPSDFADDLPTQVENILERGKKFLEDLTRTVRSTMPGASAIPQAERTSNGVKGEYYTHAENGNGSADTDLIEMSVDSVNRLKGGVNLKGGVRLK